jgi:hypothetical protein
MFFPEYDAEVDKYPEVSLFARVSAIGLEDD